MTEPTLRVLSLGAGVQSTTLLMLAAEGKLPKLDAAVFADTGWEPAAVYEHLDRLESEVAGPAGIPIYRVSNGNIRDDVLNPNKMRSIPAYTASQPYEVTVVDRWAICPDETCEWGKLRKLRKNPWDEDETPSLFKAVAYDLDGPEMVALFNAIDLVKDIPDLVDVVDLVELATSGPNRSGLDIISGDEVEEIADAAEEFAIALSTAGLSSIPDPHDLCASQGRIPVASHAEVRRDFGMQKRKCTQQYKLRPVLEQVRLLLGATVGKERFCRHCNGEGKRIAPWRSKRGENVVAECSVCDGLGTISRVSSAPKGLWVDQWIGFSTDEITRVSNRGDTAYSRSRYPLLELDMSRTQCDAYLKSRGWTSVAKSACIGCPFHGNAEWRRMRAEDPASWADAVAFDSEYRTGLGMTQERFLHISCKPLDQAPIETIQRREHKTGSVFDAVYDAELELAENGDPDGCSPWACRSGQSVDDLPAAS